MNQNFAFSASFRIIQLLGIATFAFNGDFRPYENARTRLYALLNLILCAAALAGLYYEKSLYLKSHVNHIESVVSFVQLVAVKISHLVIVGEAFYHRRRMVEFCEGLIDIDETLAEIGVKIDYRKSRRINFMVLGMFSIFIIMCGLTSSTLKWIFEGDDMLIYSISFYLPFVVMNFRYFSIFNFIWTVRARVEKLNEKLSTIQLNHDDFVDYRPLKRITTLSLTVLLRNCRQLDQNKLIKKFNELIVLRSVYDRVFKLSILLNYSHGLSCLVNVCNDFILMTSQVYFIFMLLLQNSFGSKATVELVISICCCLPSFVNILIFCTICHMTNLTVSLGNCIEKLDSLVTDVHFISVNENCPCSA